MPVHKLLQVIKYLKVKKLCQVFGGRQNVLVGVVATREPACDGIGFQFLENHRVQIRKNQADIKYILKCYKYDNYY